MKLPSSNSKVWSISAKYFCRKQIVKRGGNVVQHFSPQEWSFSWQWSSERLSGHQNSFCGGLHIHMWIHAAFCFSPWSLLTFSGQFWHFHTKTKGSTAPCLPESKTEQVNSLGHLAFKRRPSFPKFYQNFRKSFTKISIHKLPYILLLSETFAQKNVLANSGFNLRQRSFWHTKGHRNLHSRQMTLWSTLI